MQKILLFLSLLLLHGCSLNELLLKDEIDKVGVVKYDTYVKYHRAYFSRDDLQYIKANKKYIYLYNAKTNDVGILLKRKNQYLLYNMSNPKIPTIKIPTIIRINKDTNISLPDALKTYKLKGFRTTSSLSDTGHEINISYKVYKEIKTILIESKEYTRLQSLYRKAILDYDASNIQSIQTKLPKRLIQNYYKHYSSRKATRAQLLQLKIIANKLNLRVPTIPKIKKNISKKERKKEKKKKEVITVKTMPQYPPIKQKNMEEESEKRVVKNLVHKPKEKPYQYYLKSASLRELRKYITTKNSLSHVQQSKLKKRKKELEEQKLLENGSLEDIIAAYKTNKNPKYKNRIMTLMKKKQLED